MRANELVALIKKHGKKLHYEYSLNNYRQPEAFVEVNKLLEHIDDIEGFVSLLNTFANNGHSIYIDLVKILNSTCHLYCREDIMLFSIRDDESYTCVELRCAPEQCVL